MTGVDDGRMGLGAFWLSLTIPAATGVGIAFGGLWIAAVPILLFVLVPIVDRLVGLERRNRDDDPRWRIAADAPLYAWVPVQLSMLVIFVERAGAGSYTPSELVGLTIAVGLTTGAGGINVAHELMHRASSVARAASEVLMTSVSYGHFCIEHVHGHHRHVATPRDPATSRRGEGVFAFWPRSVLGGMVSAWRIESERCGGSRAVGPGADRRLRFPVMLAVAYALAWWLGGTLGVVALAGQSLVAVLLLETINYVEHYGLVRARLADGRFERVRPQHSWNASHRVSNWYLFNLQRHSDHHHVASRPYWRLRHHDDVPQLPFSYPAALLTALVPPLWRRWMDPRVDAWNVRNEARP